MIKRLLKGTLLLGVGGVFAWVLAQPDPVRERYPGREKVRFWHMWSGEWLPIVEDACRRFNESQTRYEVVPLAVPPTGADTKFLLTAAGGLAPDLVSQWMPVKGVWADKGLLKPVEEVMSPAEKAKFLREAFPIVRRQSLHRGKLVAAVASLDVYALFVRLDLLEKAGYTLDDIPRDLESFVAWSRKLDERKPDGTYRRLGFLPQYLDRYVALFGGGFGTEDAPRLDTPENRRAASFLADSVRRIGFDKVQRFTSSQAADAGPTAPLLTGSYVTILDGQWRVKQAKDFAPNVRYAVIPMPVSRTTRGPASMTNANYLLIPRAGRNPKGAWEFIKFWTGFEKPEVGAKNMAAMGWIPSFRPVADSPEYRTYLRDYPQFRTFVDLVQSPYLITPPVGPMQSFALDGLTKVDDGVFRGTAQPIPALEAAQRTLDVEMARQRRLGNLK